MPKTDKQFTEWLETVRNYEEEELNERYHRYNSFIRDCLKNFDAGEEVEKNGTILHTFFRNDLTRSGKLFCEYCGNLMEMYYSPQCFHCRKPEIIDGVGNLIMACKWLEHNEPEFHHTAMWSVMSDLSMFERNGSVITLCPNTTNTLYNKYIQLFMKHFDIENTEWEVSW